VCFLARCGIPELWAGIGTRSENDMGVQRGPEGTASHPRPQKKRSSESRLAAKCQRLTVDSNNEQCLRSRFSFQFSLSILFNSFLHVFLRVCLAIFFISGCALGLLTLALWLIVGLNICSKWARFRLSSVFEYLSCVNLVADLIYVLTLAF